MGKNAPGKSPITPQSKKKPGKTPVLVTPESKKPVQKVKSKTPQPVKPLGSTPKPNQTGKLKIPKSEPQVKRKKLVEEIDEELSDDDFDALLEHVSKKEKLLKAGKVKEAIEKAADDVAEDEDDDEMSDVDEDDDEDDGDDDEEEDEDEDEAPPSKRKRSDLDETTFLELVKSDEPETNGEDKRSKSKMKREKAKKLKQLKIDKIKSTMQVEISEDEKRRVDRDLRSLFVKNLPNDCDDAMLRTLSPDIKEVRVHFQHKKRKGVVKKTLLYAFLEFESEATAEKNMVAFKGKKLGDCEIVVDYVGSKSAVNKAGSNKPELTVIDPKKLYVSGFPLTVNKDGLKSLFPTSVDIHLPIRSKTNLPCGYAFVFFASEEQAKAAHKRLHDTEHEGHELVVLFAKKTKDEAGKERKKTKSGDTQANLEAQKATKTKKQESKAETVKKEDVTDDEEDDENDEEGEEDSESGEEDMDDNGDDDEDDDDEDDDDDDDDDDE